jgi:predicted component of type VI protein secretion system
MTQDVVDLSYKTADGKQQKLPVRLGVLGDFAGDAELPEVSRREFLRVTTPELSDLFSRLRPAIRLTAEDERGEPIPVRLTFASLADFEPTAVEEQLADIDSDAPAEATTSNGSLLDQILAEDSRPGQGKGLAAQVEQDERFQRLRAAWQGLASLAAQCFETAELIVLCASPGELLDDLDAATNIEEALLFRRLYTDMYCKPEGAPLAALVHEHAYTTHPADDNLLRYIAVVAAEAQTPVLTNADPSLIDLDWDDFAPLAGRQGLGDLLDGPQHTVWRSVRQLEEMRFVTLSLPRWRPADGGTSWIGSAFLLAGQLAHAYRRHGWPAAFAESGSTAPVEVECSFAALLLRSLNGTGLTVLEPGADDGSGARVTSAPSVHQPATFDDNSATVMASQVARLEFVSASSRVNQHVLCMARDLADDPEQFRPALTSWLDALGANPDGATRDTKHPLLLGKAPEITPDGFVVLQLCPAYQLAPGRGLPTVALPLPSTG